VRRVELAVDAPSNRLTERPASRALAIQPQLGGQAIEAPDNGSLVVTELVGAHDRRHGELTLADNRLGIDDEPRLALRGQHVVRVEILVEKHLLALCASELFQRRDRGVDQRLLERPSGSLPVGADRARPPRRLVRQEPERRPRGLPEPRHETDEDVERSLPKRDARPAALEQESVAFVVACKQADGTISLPVLERVRLLLALAMRPLDLEDRVAGRDDLRGEAAGKRLFELEIPLLGTLIDEPREALLPGVV
jgi:hypothetical protein